MGIHQVLCVAECAQRVRKVKAAMIVLLALSRSILNHLQARIINLRAAAKHVALWWRRELKKAWEKGGQQTQGHHRQQQSAETPPICELGRRQIAIPAVSDRLHITQDCAERVMSQGGMGLWAVAYEGERVCKG